MTDPTATDQRWWQFALLALLLCILAVVMAKPIILSASDLGRHITNGHLTLNQWIIPQTNLYSYVHPDFPFVNHHWATGALFAFLYDYVGFSGLSLFSIGLCLLTFFLAFEAAWLRSRFELALFYAMPIVPLLSVRPEVRPENISYLLTVIFIAALLRNRAGEDNRAMLWGLPLLQLVWVNVHIYFFVGCVIVTCFLIDDILDRRRRGEPWRTSPLLGILGACIVATLINPSGLWGALQPLLIFTNYNYPVAENQSLLQIEASTSFNLGVYFKIAFAATVFAAVRNIVRARRGQGQVWWGGLLLLTMVSVFAWSALRHVALFGYVSMIATPLLLRDLEARELRKPLSLLAAFVGTAALLFILNHKFWLSLPQQIGIGLPPKTLDAIEFYKRNNLQGPIFNDYDIGGYLIFGLHPDRQVFTDNRPEAYPGSFFSDVYIPMQMNESVWQEKLEEFEFTTIFLRRGDSAIWTRRFVAARLRDPEWVPVFADANALIFVRDTQENAQVIRLHRINPASLLRAS